MRKLPVYLLLDTSGSMMGEPIEAVKNGVDILVSTLRQNPYALETAYLSVITFDSHVKQAAPLSELSAFQPVPLSANGMTSLGGALSKVAECIKREVSQTTAEKKGDWKPLVFIMTDGEATDDLDNGIADFRQVKCGMVIACAAGANANTDELKKITETVVSLSSTDSQAFAAFFKWVSASVTASSIKVEDEGKDVSNIDQLPPPPPEVNIVV